MTSARHGTYKNWDRTLIVVRPKAPQKTEAVDERHSEIKNDGIRMALLGFEQSILSRHGSAHLIPFESQHARKCLRHALVVIDDQDLRYRRVRHGRVH